MLARLPVPAAPARHETLASYLGRLANLHGMPTSELWEPVSTPRPGTKRRDVLPDALAALVGRTRGQLARALPELRPSLGWTAWRHQSQPGCRRCDARHDGGPVARLLPHYHYVCTRHRYWIGPPDAGQPATELERGPVEFDEIVRAQHRHQRLLRRHGTANVFDAVLTGFLICGHLWDDSVGHWDQAVTRWDRRAGVLIPKNAEPAQFSASRIFAAVYPEAVEIAALITAPNWRRLAAGTEEQQQRFVREIGARLGRSDYRPPEHGDAITHWMKFDSWRPPSGPETTFPRTQEHGATRPAKTRPNSIERHLRSAIWFADKRQGGGVILHHRHIHAVLVRDWSPPMDGIQATIWASRTTADLHYSRPPRTTVSADVSTPVAEIAI